MQDKENLEELGAKIAKYEELVKARGLTPEKNPDVHKLLENARLHLGFAREAFAKNDTAGTKLHIGHVKGFLNDLSRIIEGKVRIETEIRALELRSAKPAPATKEQSGRWRCVDCSTSEDTIATTAVRSRCEDIKKSLDQLWETFKAKRISEQDYNLKSEALKKELSVCESDSSVAAPAAAEGTIKDIPPSKQAEPIYCTQQYEPVCAENGKTYSNACTAKVAGVLVKYRGECGRPEEKPLLQPAPATSVETLPSAEPVPVREPVAETAASVPAAAAMDSSFVAIDDSGQFSPLAVKVRKGGKVTWTNKSSRAVWPASAFHPTHTLYPGFDALRGLKTGETYSFVFEKAGSWKYHDHLNSGATGVVEVVE